MKYWEKIKEPITKAETPWFLKFAYCVGYVIGILIACFLATVMYLFFGFLFSLIWNFAVTPVFDVNELTSYTGAALLLLFSTAIKAAKWLFK